MASVCPWVYSVYPGSSWDCTTMPFIPVLVLAIPVFRNSNSFPGTQVLLIWNARSMISQLNFGAMPRNKMVACGTRHAMVYQF
jgi:hypothetical protein